MRDLSEIQGKYSGEIFIMGNGPSLNAVPEDFLLSKPRFAINYFPLYHKVKPTFWTCWDTSPLADMLPIAIERGIDCIVNPKDKHWFEQRGVPEPYVYWWKNEEKHQGFGFTSTHGVTYTSSIHWAAQIALYLLGFDTLLVVGFDCSTASGTYEGRGIGALPHFYDPKPDVQTRYQTKWDTQWRDMITKYHNEGKPWEIHNLSVGSKAKVFKVEDWRKWHAKVPNEVRELRDHRDRALDAPEPSGDPRVRR